MQRITHHGKEIGLKATLMVVKIQAASLAALQFGDQTSVGGM